jgi:hypothetical protein
MQIQQAIGEQEILPDGRVFKVHVIASGDLIDTVNNGVSVQVHFFGSFQITPFVEKIDIQGVQKIARLFVVGSKHGPYHIVDKRIHAGVGAVVLREDLYHGIPDREQARRI